MKRKYILNLLIALIVLVIAAVLTAAAMIYSRAASTAQARLTIQSDTNLHTALGDTVVVQLHCFVPWGQQLGSMTFMPNEGITLSGEVSSEYQSLVLNGINKLITLHLRSYRTDNINPGKLTVEIDRAMYKNGSRKLILTAEIPSLDVQPQPITDRNQLPLMDEIAEPESKTMNHLPVIAAVIAALILLIFIIIRKRKSHQTVPELPLWQTACNDLAALRQTAESGKQPLEWCVSRLTDVVRNYLSKRFQLPVTRQTTEEFFAMLKRGQSPLNSSQTGCLEKFMHTADLVKFANIKADLNDFSSAVTQAEELVMQTSGGDEKSVEKNQETAI